jgi:hypothetical protein
MGAGTWEACCTACSETTFLNGYSHPAPYDAVSAAERQFLLDDTRDDWRGQVQEIALTADNLLQSKVCRCGSRFSLAAQPRCPQCAAVLLESYFHYAYLPSPLSGTGEGI